MNRIISLWLCFVLAGSSAIVLVGGGDEPVEGKEVVRDGVTYTTHAPIRINSDADFSIGINGVTGGDGSQGNPWVIENYDINGTGYEDCIYIGNTTVYYQVKGCCFHDSINGIYLFCVINSRIKNNTITHNGYSGVRIHGNTNNNSIFNKHVTP